MFKAMKKIKKIKSKPVLVINHKNQYTANEWKQVRIIANHFTKRFKRDKPQTTMFRSSTQMKIPFSKEENIHSY